MNARTAGFWSARRADTQQLMQNSGASGWSFGRELAWQKRAACAKADRPDAFFPGGGRPSNKSKEFCADCPVRVQCLDWALVHEEEGIWGGLTEAERSKLVLSRLPLFITKETK